MAFDLKRFPILVAALCCIWAIFSPAASAEFNSSEEHTVIDGAQAGTDSFVFNAGQITCSTIIYSATQSTKASSIITLAPTYSSCNAFGFIGVTIDVNECKIVLHQTSELTDVSCGAKPIEVTAPNCTLTIGSQTGLTSSTFTTEGTTPKRDVKAKLGLTGLKYTQTGKGEPPCTSKEFSDGTYTAEATLTGTNTTGTQIDFWAEDPPNEFHSALAHTTLDGTQVGSDSLVFNAGKISCTTITYSGTVSTETSTTASLTPAYSGCNAFGFSGVTIDVNSCQIVLHTTTGLTDISCPSKPIEVTAPNCTLTIDSQTGLTSSTFLTEEAAGKSDVKLKLKLIGLSYAQTGKGETPCTTKTGTDGSYTAEATITGTDPSSKQVDFWFGPADERGTGRFRYSSSHTAIDGAQIGSENFTVNAGTWKCNSITYAGTASATATTTLTFTPTYSECSAFGFASMVFDVNGCQWVFSPEGVELVCPGSPMSITAFNCWITLGSQSLTGGVTYTNEESESKRDIKIGINETGIKYTQDSKSFPGCSAKTFTDGKWTGEYTITGTNTSGAQVAVWYE